MSVIVSVRHDSRTVGSIVNGEQTKVCFVFLRATAVAVAAAVVEAAAGLPSRWCCFTFPVSGSLTADLDSADMAGLGCMHYVRLVCSCIGVAVGVLACITFAVPSPYQHIAASGLAFISGTCAG